MPRTIKLKQDFMVDSVYPVHDGAGVVWYAIQEIDRDDGNRKFCRVYRETTPGTFEKILRVDAIIGAPHIVTRPDGTAYVAGGGRDNTIETGHSLPGFVPTITAAAIRALVARIATLEAKG